MTPDELSLLKKAYQSLVDEPIEPDDLRYVAIYGTEGVGDDPIERMAHLIRLSPGESVQLFSAFRGTGKSTELNRLHRRLAADGYKVVRIDVDDHLHTSNPLDVNNFTAMIAHRFGEAMRHPDLLGRALDNTKEARLFISECVAKLKKRHGAEVEVVLLVDSLEHVQSAHHGMTATLASLEALFAAHASKLKLPNVHVVYTIPPYLKMRWANVGQIYGGPVHVLPAIGVSHIDGGVSREGLNALEEVVKRRLDPALFLSDKSLLKQIILSSGGNIRDLLRILREIVSRARSLPVDAGVVDDAIHQIRSEFLPISDEDVAPPGTTTPLPSTPGPAPVALTPDMRVTLVVQDYRALGRVRWTFPRGVCALVGPNGSGKTTLLDVPELLRHALEHDVRRAIDARGGPGSIRRKQAARDAPVLLGVEVDQVAWQLDLSPRGASHHRLQGEQATVGGALAFDRSAQVPGLVVRPDDARPLLARFAELPEGAALRPLVTLLKGYRLYAAYDLANIRMNGSQVSSDEHLHPDGRNIFSVLRNWRDRKETRARWEFVVTSLKQAFPDTFDDLDFDMAGQTISGHILAPEPEVRIPTYLAANGWLVALLHLAAVASTEPAGAVAIDEVENGLHPYAIRQLIEAMRSWSARTGITVVLSTHSPVVIDQFKEEPDHLFVMEPGRETQPVRLDELHDPEWLAHFSLGDLYAHDEFGAQHKDGGRVA
ncbi:MAG TPA: AAA family ATPase [Candidatus Nanopelagicales bacterium]|nr:AAA family ATPase [Candidatus Nanopelagicales bacterium]